MNKHYSEFDLPTRPAGVPGSESQDSSEPLNSSIGRENERRKSNSTGKKTVLWSLIVVCVLVAFGLLAVNFQLWDVAKRTLVDKQPAATPTVAPAPPVAPVPQPAPSNDLQPVLAAANSEVEEIVTKVEAEEVESKKPGRAYVAREPQPNPLDAPMLAYNKELLSATTVPTELPAASNQDISQMREAYELYMQGYKLENINKAQAIVFWQKALKVVPVDTELERRLKEKIRSNQINQHLARQGY